MERKTLGKRVDRAPNFTQNETRLLVKLCLNAKHIIENKQTDSNLWKLKDETWQKICLEFNATSGTIPRTACGLKAKYEGIKKTLKKKVIKNKEESTKTGGGIPKLEAIEGPERDLLVVLNTQVNGMPSSNDCDFRLLNTDLSGMLKEKKDEPVLENPNEKMVADEMECFDVSHEYLDMNSPNQLNDNIIFEVVEDDAIKAGEDKAEEDTGTLNTSSDANWSKRNPNLLKTKKRGVLTSNVKRKPLRKQDVGENVNNLMAERQSLVELQKELLLKEEERNEREHSAVMEKIRLEKLLSSKNDVRLEKEHLLKMRILEQEFIKKRKWLLNTE